MFRKFAMALSLLVAGVLTGCGGGTGISNNQPGPGNGNGTNSGLNASVSSIDFGNVTVGGTKTSTLTLTNSSSDSITVNQLQITGSGFTLSSALSTPFTVLANGNTTVGVTFAPTKASSVTGSLSVATSASTTNLGIGLQGVGIMAGQMGVSPSALNLGNVTVGSKANGSIVLSNPAGGATITITQLSASGTGFSLTTTPSLPIELAAGQNTTIGVTFTANSAGSASGDLTVESDASNSSLSVGLQADGISQGQLASLPSSLTLGPISIGHTATGSVSLNNSEGQSVTVSQLSISGAGFSFTTQPSLPMTIQAGQSVPLGVSFTPTGTGDVTGNIAVTSNATDQNFSIGLSGDGLGANQLGVSPSTFTFGSVEVDTSKALPGSLTAGTSDVVISSANWAGSGYSVSGISFPVTVTAGTSVPFTVTFDPGSAGASTGNVSFTSNATNSPTDASFNGTGTAPMVSLAWSDGGQVSGYNIYRGTSSGGPYPNKLNSSLIPQTSFTDTTVQSGTTYYYVTTAVNNGQESAYSNPATAAVP